MKPLTIALLLALAAPAAFAEDTDTEKEKEPTGWKSSGELGFVSSSGNTESDSLNVRLGTKFEDEDWKHDFHLAGFRQRGEVEVQTDPNDPNSTERRTERTANRYELGGSTARKLDERNSIYTSLRYEHDDFAAYDYQATLSVGWGHQLIKTDATDLRFEAGPGIKRTRDAVTRETNSALIGRGKGNLETKLTDNTSLVDELLVEAGGGNTYVQNDFGVKVAMNSHLAIKAGLQHRHNTEVPPERKKTDTLTTVNLVYDF